jgi:asparagine synthase (glutamine-hydrolysing)
MSREIDPRAIDEYLTYQYVPHPRTIFRHIAKLPPASYAVYRDGQLTVQSYWQPPRPVANETPATSEIDHAAALREAMTASVKLRMQSDVPLGAFLSGGVDSTLVVGLMSQLSAEPVRTFSIGFPVPEYDETSFARLAAERFGTIHEEFIVEPDALAVLPKLIWHFDEPFGDSSAIPTWYVSQLSRQHVTVALTGDGGDELFLGYPRYRAVWLSGFMPKLLRRMCSWPLWQKIPASPRQKSLRRQLKRFLASIALSPQRRYLEWISIFQESQRGQLYDESFLASLPDSDPMEFLSDAFAMAEGSPAVAATGLADLLTYLPCDLMTKVDMASMAHGLECRQPFLDHRVVELATQMPEEVRFRGGRGKRILCEAFGDLLPEVIQRRPKMGFGVPLDHWFKNELKDFARDILLDSRTTARGYFRADAVRRLLDDHQHGRFDHASRLWSLLVLELWHREWVDM